MIRTYSELIALPTYKERFDYLKLIGQVGNETFGFDRYLNQSFYKSQEWRRLRREIIIRDNCCDLAHEDYSISNQLIMIHHMNPITQDDIVNRMKYIMEPEFLITTVFNTHNAIHYGDESLLILDPVERKPNDTCPWK